MEVNQQQVSQLVDYYQKQGKLIEVDGLQEISAVGRDLLAALAAPGEARIANHPQE